ncbi:MAG: rhodanese-like domain-containing protein, partial [Gelidibacter sp.]|nr:rhodanese-like domain-containing protein [Gelidibacter sp.]
MKGIFFFISFLAVIGLQAQDSIDAVLKTHNKNNIPYISVTEARMLQLQGKAILVDARNREEFEVSAIASAKHINSHPFSFEEFEKSFPNKNELIIVYCSLGVRSEDFAEKLKKIGYTQVKNLYGGIFEWK